MSSLCQAFITISAFLHSLVAIAGALVYGIMLMCMLTMSSLGDGAAESWASHFLYAFTGLMLLLLACMLLWVSHQICSSLLKWLGKLPAEKTPPPLNS